MDEDVEDLLKVFKKIIEYDSKFDIVEDGLYKGCIIRYKNGLEIYHPYIPLQTTNMDGSIQSISSVKLKTRYNSQRIRDGYPVYEDMIFAGSERKQ